MKMEGDVKPKGMVVKFIMNEDIKETRKLKTKRERNWWKKVKP